MKEIFGWLAKKVLLPLVPFMAGALIRYLHAGRFSLNIFDGGELSFSMALSYILVMSSVNRLNDKILRDSLTTPCVFGIVFFLVMFASSSFIKVQMEVATSEGIFQLKNLLVPGASVPPLALQCLNEIHLEKSLKILNTIRTAAIVLSLITVPLLMFFKIRYDLED